MVESMIDCSACSSRGRPLPRAGEEAAGRGVWRFPGGVRGLMACAGASITRTISSSTCGRYLRRPYVWLLLTRIMVTAPAG